MCLKHCRSLQNNFKPAFSSVNKNEFYLCGKLEGFSLWAVWSGEFRVYNNNKNC